MSAPPLLGLLSQKLFQNQRLISVCDARHDIIVIGASAGGVQALRTLVAGFPAHLRASLFIVMHIAASLPTTLPQILSRAGPLPALHPTENMVIEQGKIYVAPPDHHLLLEEGHMYLGTGPKELRVRPAANTLFRSAAHAYEPRVVGVVLTGTDRDGTAGLQAVKQQGGITIVQDPQGLPGLRCHKAHWSRWSLTLRSRCRRWPRCWYASLSPLSSIRSSALCHY